MYDGEPAQVPPHVQALNELGRRFDALSAAGEPVTVVMVNHVGTKLINHVFGLGGGDQVLAYVEDSLRARFGENMCRQYGNWVALSTAQPPGSSGEAWIEQLRRDVATDVACTYHAGPVTVSVAVDVGAAIRPADGATFRECLRVADERCHEARTERRTSEPRWYSVTRPAPPQPGLR